MLGGQKVSRSLVVEDEDGIPLLNHIAEHSHHCLRLLFREPFILQSLYELERVEMVVPRLGSCCAEVATESPWVTAEGLRDIEAYRKLGRLDIQLLDSAKSHLWRWPGNCRK